MKLFLLKLKDKNIKLDYFEEQGEYEVHSSSSFEEYKAKDILNEEVDNKFGKFIQDKIYFWYICYSALFFLIMFFILSIIPDPFIIWDEVVVSFSVSILLFYYNKKNMYKSRSYVKTKEKYYDNLNEFSLYKETYLDELETYINANFREDIDDVIKSSKEYKKEIYFLDQMLFSLKKNYSFEFKIALDALNKKGKNQSKFLSSSSYVCFLIMILLVKTN